MSERIKLISCDMETLDAAIQGDVSLGDHLNCTVATNWNSFGTEALSFARDQLSNPENQEWWAHFVLHKDDNRVIGNGGFKGPPDPEGNVEIGYEIAPKYRNQGYAGEMARLLIEKAKQDHRTKKVIAHTLAESNASTRVLLRQGFIKTNEIEDPDDGLIWKWELQP